MRTNDPETCTLCTPDERMIWGKSACPRCGRVYPPADCSPGPGERPATVDVMRSDFLISIDEDTVDVVRIDT